MFSEVAVGIEAVVILAGAVIVAVIAVVVVVVVAAVVAGFAHPGVLSFLAVLLVAELSRHPVTLRLRLGLDDGSLLDATPHRRNVATVQPVAVALRHLRTIGMSVFEK